MNADGASRQARVRLPSDAASVRRAREHVATFLDGHEIGGEIREVARLLVSELATNAIKHGSGEVTVTVRLEGDQVVVEVADSSSRPPQVRPTVEPDPEDDDLAENGRGLQLVQALADSWGVAPAPDGKRVHFRMRTTRRATADEQSSSPV